MSGTINWGDNAPIAASFMCAICRNVFPTVSALVDHCNNAAHGHIGGDFGTGTWPANTGPNQTTANVTIPRYRPPRRRYNPEWHSYREQPKHAESKAWLLLAEVLGFDAAYSLMDPDGPGRLDVQGSNGKTYFVTRDGELANEKGEFMCVQPLETYPLADKILMKVLWLKTNAAGVEKIANDSSKVLTSKGVDGRD